MRAFIFLFLTIGALFLSLAQSTQNDKSLLESFMSKKAQKGFSGVIFVAKQGKILIEQGYGYANEAQNIPNSPEIVFDIGSITKQFTGAAILHLQMEGKLKVTDKLSAYFDKVPADKEGITLHHLLTHSAGFPGAIGRDYSAISTEEFMEKAFKTPLKFSPGTKYTYSNVGYSILGIILEQVSGKSYEAYLRENLWIPSGMEHTGYLLPKFAAEDLAVGYTQEKAWGRPTDKKWDTEGPYWHLKANGGVLSTVKDMYAWHQALAGIDILDDSAKAQYYAPHIEEGKGSGTYYGYGWVHVPTRKGTTLYMHNGGNGIFFADMLRFIEEEITVIILSNKARRADDRLAFELAKIIR